MPTDYSITELANLADVPTRTIRYYIAQGLLPAPVQQGPNTRYTNLHLDRLRLIKKLQTAHLPLAEIRRQLGAAGDMTVATLSETPGETETTGSALDYIDALLPRSEPAPASSDRVFMRRASAPAVVPPPPAEPAAAPPLTNTKPVEPDRAQWERITLDPDIEL